MSTRMFARAWLIVLAAACASGAVRAATAEPEPAATDADAPAYNVDECCKLCPHAADPAVYDVSKYAADFRVLIDGRNGWLFRTVMDLTTTYPITDQGYLQLRRLSDALRARGTQLVIVYQPPRGLMDPEELQPKDRTHYDHALALKNYRQVLQNLRERSGVVVVPIDQLADENKGYEYFFRRDHHWSPAGAERTAKLVADTLRGMPQFAGIPHQEFVTRRNGVISKPGTLQKIAAQACNAGYSLQYVPAFTTEQAGESSLLGESAAPEIALIGTSNSDPKGGYNFGGFLQQYLGADILNQAITGGSFEGALLHYLPSEEFQKHPPKILVWEMPYQNLPSEDRKMDKVVRQAVPLVNNGCAGRAPLLSAKDLALQPGTNEVLFNGGGRILPILSKDHVLDIQFSDPGIKDLHGIVWYMNGRKESLKIHFTQYVDNGGRFVAELRHDQAIYADSTFMAFNLMLDQPPPKPLKVNVQLCARVDTPAGPKSTIASR